MPLISDQPAEPKKRKGRSWALGCLGGLAITGLVVAGYVGWANLLPPEPAPPTVTLPNPNGYDAVNAATFRVKGAPGNGAVSDPQNTTPQVLQEAVEAHQPSLMQLRAALLLPYVNPVVDPEGDHWAPFASYRQAARALAAESLVARRSGQHARAVSSGLDALELGVKMQRGGTYIHTLVAVAVCAIGLRETEASIPHLSEAEARRLGARLDGILAATVPFPEIVRTESRATRIAFLREARRPPRLAPDFDGEELDLKEKARRILVRYFYPKGGFYTAISDYFAEAEVAMAKPYWQRKRPTYPADPNFENFGGDMLASVADAHARHLAQIQLLRLELALQEHRRRTGGFPDRLDALVPQTVAAVPPDPFTGRPLQYRRQGASCQLYSVGTNGVDDNGQPALPQTPHNGDLVAGRLIRQLRPSPRPPLNGP